MEFQSFKIILDFKKVYMRRLFWLSKYPVSLTRLGYMRKLYAPLHDKTNKVACAPSEDSDQPGHPPSLIRVFAVRMKKAWVLSYPLSAQRRLRWAQTFFCWFCHEAVHILCACSCHSCAYLICLAQIREIILEGQNQDLVMFL